jgi:hypothetical protein
MTTRRDEGGTGASPGGSNDADLPNRIFLKSGMYVGYTVKKVNKTTSLVVDELTSVGKSLCDSVRKLAIIGRGTNEGKGKKNRGTEVSGNASDTKVLREKIEDLTEKLGAAVYSRVMESEAETGSNKKIDELVKEIDLYKGEIEMIERDKLAGGKPVTEKRAKGKARESLKDDVAVKGDRPDEEAERPDFEGLAREAHFETASARMKFIQAARGLGSNDPRVRKASAHKLINHGKEQAVAILEKAFAFEIDGGVRAEILRSLSRCGDEKIIPMLREILLDGIQVGPIRTAAMEGLYEIEREGCTEVLRGCLSDPDSVIRRRSTAYLAWLGDRSSAPVIISLLNDMDSSIRKEAVNALGVLRLKSTVSPLIESLLDHDDGVRGRAYQVLLNLVAVPPLENLGAPLNERILEVKALKKWWEEKRSSFPEVLTVRKKRQPSPQERKEGAAVVEGPRDQENQ